MIMRRMRIPTINRGPGVYVLVCTVCGYVETRRDQVFRCLCVHNLWVVETDCEQVFTCL